MTSANQDISGIDLSSLPPGLLTISVTLTDLAGYVSNPVTANAMIDPDAPTAIELSSSSATDGSTIGTVVGLLATVGPQSNSTYTYSLVSGTGSTDNASFQISGNELQMAATVNSAIQSTYSIRLQSTDSLGKSVQQQFLITVNAGDPIAATLSPTSFSVAPIRGTALLSARLGPSRPAARSSATRSATRSSAAAEATTMLRSRS